MLKLAPILILLLCESCKPESRQASTKSAGFRSQSGDSTDYAQIQQTYDSDQPGGSNEASFESGQSTDVSGNAGANSSSGTSGSQRGDTSGSQSGTSSGSSSSKTSGSQNSENDQTSGSQNRGSSQDIGSSGSAGTVGGALPGGGSPLIGGTGSGDGIDSGGAFDPTAYRVFKIDIPGILSNPDTPYTRGRHVGSKVPYVVTDATDRASFSLYRLTDDKVIELATVPSDDHTMPLLTTMNTIQDASGRYSGGYLRIPHPKTGSHEISLLLFSENYGESPDYTYKAVAYFEMVHQMVVDFDTPGVPDTLSCALGLSRDVPLYALPKAAVACSYTDRFDRTVWIAWGISLKTLEVYPLTWGGMDVEYIYPFMALTTEERKAYPSQLLSAKVVGVTVSEKDGVLIDFHAKTWNSEVTKKSFITSGIMKIVIHPDGDKHIEIGSRYQSGESSETAFLAADQIGYMPVADSSAFWHLSDSNTIDAKGETTTVTHFDCAGINSVSYLTPATDAYDFSALGMACKSTLGYANTLVIARQREPGSLSQYSLPHTAENLKPLFLTPFWSLAEAVRILDDASVLKFQVVVNPKMPAVMDIQGYPVPSRPEGSAAPIVPIGTGTVKDYDNRQIVFAITGSPTESNSYLNVLAAHAIHGKKFIGEIAPPELPTAVVACDYNATLVKITNHYEYIFTNVTSSHIVGPGNVTFDHHPDVIIIPREMELGKNGFLPKKGIVLEGWIPQPDDCVCINIEKDVEVLGYESSGKDAYIAMLLTPISSNFCPM